MTPATRWAEIEETSIIAESNPTFYNEEGDGVQLGREVDAISSKNLWDEEW